MDSLSKDFRDRVKDMVVVPRDLYEKCLSNKDKAVQDMADSINIRQFNNFCKSNGNSASKEDILKKVNIKYVDKEGNGGKPGSEGTVTIDDWKSPSNRKKPHVSVSKSSVNDQSYSTGNDNANIDDINDLNQSINETNQSSSSRFSSQQPKISPVSKTKDFAIQVSPGDLYDYQTGWNNDQNTEHETSKADLPEQSVGSYNLDDSGEHDQTFTSHISTEDNPNFNQSFSDSIHDTSHLSDSDEYFTAESVIQDKDSILEEIAPKLSKDQFQDFEWDEISEPHNLSKVQTERLANQHRQNLKANDSYVKAHLRNRIKNRKRFFRSKKKPKKSMTTSMPLLDNPIDYLMQEKEELERLERLQTEQENIKRDQAALDRQQEEFLSAFDPNSILVENEQTQTETGTVESNQNSTKDIEQNKSDEEKIDQSEQQQHDEEGEESEKIIQSDEFEKKQKEVDKLEVKMQRLEAEMARLLSQYRNTSSSSLGRQKRLKIKQKIDMLRPSYRNAILEYGYAVREADKRLIQFLKKSDATHSGLDSATSQVKRLQYKNKNKPIKEKKTVPFKDNKQRKTRASKKEIEDKKKVSSDHNSNTPLVTDLTLNKNGKNKSKPDLTAGHLADYTGLSRKSRNKQNKNQVVEEENPPVTKKPSNKRKATTQLGGQKQSKKKKSTDESSNKRKATNQPRGEKQRKKKKLIDE